MGLTAIDRRGLGEIVAWSCATVMTGAVLIAKLLVTKEIDGILMAQFIGVVTILVARGTQGAAERSAVKDLQKPAPAAPPPIPEESEPRQL